MATQVFSTEPDKKGQLVTRWLTSGSSTYEVQSFVGQGAYGIVAKCLRMEDKKTVAIKMIKQQSNHKNRELDALKILKSLDPDKCNLVRWYHDFIDKEYVCLVFEYLDKSLYDFISEKNGQPLLLMEIRPIVQQLATALNHLKAAGIIHADLKPENVMLVNHLQEPYRVKIIDFGLACNILAARTGSYIQSRFFRSPEIILGYPFTEAIDMWSLGCMAASMYLGKWLYPGRSEYDMIKFITHTQGQLPRKVLHHGSKTSTFFQSFNTSTTTCWKLKSSEQIHKQTGIQPKETRSIKLSSLDGLLHIRTFDSKGPDLTAEKTDVRVFVDMLKGMLHLDATKRMTPNQVLEHQFTCMTHLVNRNSQSGYVRACYSVMKQNDTAPSVSGAAAQRSAQEPESAGTAQTTESDSSGWNRNVVDGNLNTTTAVTRPKHVSEHPARSTSSIKWKMPFCDSKEHKGSNLDHDTSDHEKSYLHKSSAGPTTSACSSVSHGHM
nr:PREDICTED: homeodomain-interacting protein kinase 1-like isoform X1 [Paralichthys olivaceus]